MNRTTGQGNTSPWVPPSDVLELRDGIWYAKQTSAVSYPNESNDLCFLIEEQSYWFSHRNDCLRELVRRFKPGGTIYDIGGGNGFVAAGLQQDGYDVVVVEPGTGAKNAVRRGVSHVIQATLQDACFHERSIPAIGAFDVIEHIQDDVAFLRDTGRLLKPAGRFYCAVPAFPFLWSREDVAAGHFRRYTIRSLRNAFNSAGFEVEFLTYFFSWLVPPVFVSRVVLGRKETPAPAQMASDHHMPPLLAPVLNRVNAWERNRISRQKAIPFGSSLLCVARKTG